MKSESRDHEVARHLTVPIDPPLAARAEGSVVNFIGHASQTTTETSDAILIDRARSGDPQAFREIVERYESAVAATAIGMLGRNADAEDAGQEAFIRLYKSLSRFRGASNLRTYLTRITINICLDFLRRRQRNQRRFWRLDSDADEDRLPEQLIDREPETLEEKDRQAAVREAILELEPRQRAVVVTRMIQGYSTRETAELLGIPQGTVMSRLSRAQEKLKQLLEPQLRNL